VEGTKETSTQLSRGTGEPRTGPVEAATPARGGKKKVGAKGLKTNVGKPKKHNDNLKTA